MYSTYIYIYTYMCTYVYMYICMYIYIDIYVFHIIYIYILERNDAPVPATMTATMVALPSGVTGTMSPNPTVVRVVTEK